MNKSVISEIRKSVETELDDSKLSEIIDAVKKELIKDSLHFRLREGCFSIEVATMQKGEIYKHVQLVTPSRNEFSKVQLTQSFNRICYDIFELIVTGVKNENSN